MYLVCDSLPVGQDAALKEGPKLPLDKSRHGVAPLVGPGEEGLKALLHDTVEDSLLGSPGLVANAGGALPWVVELSRCDGHAGGQLRVPCR